MNRFLSKLDLRDIKIDPRGSRFPPDEAAYTRDNETQSEPSISETAVDQTETAQAPVLDQAPDSAVSGEPLATTAGADVAQIGEVLKVSARSRPSAVAGAIAGVVRDGILPGYYGYEAGQPATGDIFAWFLRAATPADTVREAEQRGVTPHGILEEKAAAVQRFAHEVVPHLASGRMRAIVDRVFPVDEAADAFDHMAGSGKFGKVLLSF